MDLNTIMYGGLTRKQLRFFVLVMLVISHISVVLHVRPTRANTLSIS